MAPPRAVPAGPVVTPTRMPRGDILRDVAAAVLLCAPLGLIWSYAATGERIFTLGVHRPEVVVATVLSVLSLLVTQLRRSRVLPPTLSLRRVVFWRAIINVPYVGVALVYAILSCVPGLSLGPGLFVGLLGAFFAAQPRRAEAEVMAPDDVVVRVVRRTVVGYLLVAVGLLAVVAVTRVITYAMGGRLAIIPGVFAGGYAAVVSLVLLAGIFIACLLSLVRAVRRGREAVCLAGVGVAVIGLVLAVASSLASTAVLGQVRAGEAVRTAVWGFPEQSFWVFAPLFALLTDPALRRALPPIDGAVRWFGTASTLLSWGMIYGGYLWASVLYSVGWLNLGPRMTEPRFMEHLRDGLAILALTTVAWGLVATARRVLRRRPGRSRLPVLVLLALVVALGVPVALLGGQLPGLETSQQQPVFYLGLPLLVALILLVPRPVRGYYSATRSAISMR